MITLKFKISFPRRTIDRSKVDAMFKPTKLLIFYKNSSKLIAKGDETQFFKMDQIYELAGYSQREKSESLI